MSMKVQLFLTQQTKRYVSPTTSYLKVRTVMPSDTLKDS